MTFFQSPPPPVVPPVLPPVGSTCVTTSWFHWRKHQLVLAAQESCSDYAAFKRFHIHTQQGDLGLRGGSRFTVCLVVQGRSGGITLKPYKTTSSRSLSAHASTLSETRLRESEHSAHSILQQWVSDGPTDAPVDVWEGTPQGAHLGPHHMHAVMLQEVS